MSTICVQDNFILARNADYFITLSAAIGFMENRSGVNLNPTQRERLNRLVDQLIAYKDKPEGFEAGLATEVWDYAFHAIYPTLIRQAHRENKNLRVRRYTQSQDAIDSVCYTIEFIDREDDSPPLPPLSDYIREAPENPFPDPTRGEVPPPDIGVEITGPDAGETSQQPTEPPPRQPTQPPTREPQSSNPRLRPPPLPRQPRETSAPPTREPSPDQIPAEEDTEIPSAPEEGESDEEDTEEPSEIIPQGQVIDLLKQIRDEIEEQGKNTQDAILRTAGATLEEINDSAKEIIDAEENLLNSIQSEFDLSRVSLEEAITAQTDALIAELQTIGQPEQEAGEETGVVAAIDRLGDKLVDGISSGLVDAIKSVDNTLSGFAVGMIQWGEGLGQELVAGFTKTTEAIKDGTKRTVDFWTEQFTFDTEQIKSEMCSWVKWFMEFIQSCSSLNNKR